MDVIGIEDIVEEEAESNYRSYAVKKPVELFCGLYINKNDSGKLEMYRGETIKLNDFLFKINEYLNWIKENKTINNEMEKNKIIKIIYGVLGIEDNGNKKSMFLCYNEKGTTFWLETDNEKIKITKK